MDISVSAAYESKRREAERLRNNLQSDFRECFEELCSLDGVDDLPTIKDAKNKQSYYCEHIDLLVNGVNEDLKLKTESESAAKRKELDRLDKVIADIDAMKL